MDRMCGPPGTIVPGSLVHMNGRIYDPLLGRFLSADLEVQNPSDLQSYNRYSYVHNRPLSFTDPDGEQAVAVETVPIVFLAVAGTAIYMSTSSDGRAALGNAWNSSMQALQHSNGGVSGKLEAAAMTAMAHIVA
jgi:RHS repeat-associated protein